MVVDLLFPPKCVSCSAPGSRWCLDCQSKVPLLTEPYCEKCAQPGVHTNLCAACRTRPPVYEQARAWGLHHGTLRLALHHLKYRRDVGLGEIFATQLIDIVAQMEWTVDLVLPVPLGKARQRSRGYNQAAQIARPLAYLLRKPYKPHTLQRIKEMDTQVGLDVAGRHANLEGAFQADERLVSGRRVLLIDGVLTTGATMDAAAAALKAAHAREVFALAVARVD